METSEILKNILIFTKWKNDRKIFEIVDFLVRKSQDKPFQHKRAGISYFFSVIFYPVFLHTLIYPGKNMYRKKLYSCRHTGFVQLFYITIVQDHFRTKSLRATAAENLQRSCNIIDDDFKNIIFFFDTESISTSNSINKMIIFQFR